MPSMTLKNVSDELAERLRLSARENHRSLNGEILSRLTSSFRDASRREADPALRELELLHQRLGYVKPTTTEEIVAWIRADRDSR